MVDHRAARLALVVAGAAMTVLLAGQVARFLSRMVSWGLLVLLVVLLAYATYELYGGWRAADEDASALESTAEVERDADDGTADGDASNPGLELNRAELEAELDRLVDGEATDLERE
ncbi:hypothetical protein [Halovivax sp.]|uniref:hypothetical protein n=1 Tax=Halovivax sp. TaxID=1935978 RepID=UPI0025B85353|nr:hypothetical protein [Halovivax sp.]